MSQAVTKKILIVDDEKDIRSTLNEILSDQGYQTFLAATGVQARQLWRQHIPDIIYLDIWLPDTEGTILLKELKQEGFLEHTPVIMMSGHGTLSKAIEAIQLGAYDFLEKPITLSKLLVTADRAAQHQDFLLENNHLQGYAPLPPRLISNSKFVKEQQETVERLAKFTMPILITGAKGTGKQSYAKALHYASERNKSPLQVLSAARFSTNLSSWIGSADSDNFQLGKLQNLKGGTLVLTDIEHLSTKAQEVISSLIFQEGYKADQAAELLQLDLRIICTCSQDLEKLAAEDNFNKELAERLKVMEINTPNLNTRSEDIPELAQVFMYEFCGKHNLPAKVFNPEALQVLTRRSWPNNLLDLKATVAQLALQVHGDVITPEDLTSSTQASTSQAPAEIDVSQDLRTARDEFETNYFKQLLIQTQGSVSEVAQLSGLERTNLYRKLKTLNIDPKNPI